LYLYSWINEGLKIVNKILPLSVQKILMPLVVSMKDQLLRFVTVSTFSLLFRNTYVKRCVYMIHIESKVGRHAAAHVQLLNLAFGFLVFRVLTFV
jgi:hypothetical protein